MKKVFLRITHSDRFYKDYKNLNLFYWGEDFKKKGCKSEKRYFFKSQSNKNRIRRNKLAHIISLRVIKFFYKNLLVDFDKKVSAEEYEIIFYPFIQSLTFMILDRQSMVDEFFSRNKLNNISISKIHQNESDFIRNSTIDFLKITQTEAFNKFLIFNILNRNKKINIEFKKNNLKDKKKIIYEKNFNIFFKIRNFFKKLLAKLSYNINETVFETFYCPKLKFIKICLTSGIFPYKISGLFDNNFNSNINQKKRNILKNSIKKSKLSDQEKLVSEIIVNLMPKNYLENINQIINHFSFYTKKKKIITSTSFYYNEIFRIFLVLAKRNNTKIVQCDHSGGLKFKDVPIYSYIQKKIFDNFAIWGKNLGGLKIPIKKKIFINPSLNSLNIDLDNYNKDHLSILFYESRKFTIEYDALQSFENQNKALNDLIYMTKKLPREIKDTIIFRPLQNFGLYAKDRYKREVQNLKKHKKNIELSKSFENVLKNSKLIISNFPSTTFSEALSLNIPMLLFCNENEILFDEKSKNFFIKMKKNKIAFDDKIKLLKHIKKVWHNPNIWWKKKNIQNLRTNYLRNYFNTIDDLKPTWIRK